jgi:hypothetical protein
LGNRFENQNKFTRFAGSALLGMTRSLAGGSSKAGISTAPSTSVTKDKLLAGFREINQRFSHFTGW